MADEADGSPTMRAALEHYEGFEGAHVVRLPGGLLHATFGVTAGGREYIAQRVNPMFAAGIHTNIDGVTRHLERAGVATPRLIPARSGALCVDLDAGGRWRLMTREPGTTRDTCAGPAEARSAAQLVGEFHRALLDFDAPLHPMGIPYHDTIGYLRALQRAVRVQKGHALHGEVADLASRILAAASHWPVHDDLPTRVIHGDLKFSNVLFVEARRRASALIDLDTLCRLPLTYDLGDAWRSWCNPLGEDEGDAVLDLGVLEASAAGYLDVMDPHLGEVERASLAEGLERISLELAARFATDALEATYFSWNPERFASASEHNIVRARGQWRLHEHAVEQRGEIRHFLGLRG